MVNLSHKQLLIAGGGLAIFLLVVVLFVSNIRSIGTVTGPTASLTVWGIDPPGAWESVIGRYLAARPNISVRYFSIDPLNYRSSVVDALAAGVGPDVFYVGNRDILREGGKIVAVDQRQFSIPQIRDLFPVAVEEDFVWNGRIWALPAYLDTLAFIYNRDIFDQAGIAEPPRTWDEFLRIIPALRKRGPGGQIEKAAAAIGGTEKSVDAGIDLLNLLMLQNGTDMNNKEKTTAAFSAPTGIKAFDFYLQFANAASPNFTWNDSAENSLQSFAGGRAAAIFNYQSSIPKIKNISPFINIKVAPMLQVTGSNFDMNYAGYHGLAVSKQSRAQGWAWDFIVFVATDKTSAKLYADASGRPPALRSVIGEKINDADIGIFAKQALTARSWLAPSSDAVKEILSAAVSGVLTGRLDSANALNQAEGQVNQLYPR